MTFKQFLNSLSVPRRAELAARCGTSIGYLRQIAYGNRRCSPKLAVCLERESGGVITRKGLRPDDWVKLWPEMADRELRLASDTASSSLQRGMDPIFMDTPSGESG